jgi:hypothetical protein
MSEKWKVTKYQTRLKHIKIEGRKVWEKPSRDGTKS